MIAMISSIMVDSACQHLAKLCLAGRVDSRGDGRRRLYRVVDPHITTLVHPAVEHVLDLRSARTPER